MDVFTNTNKFKKIVIVLVFIILFNFCCPKIVRAGDALDWILVGVSSLFFWLFDGIQGLVDLFFLDDPNTNDVTAESIIKGRLLIASPNIFEDFSTKSSYYWDYNKVNAERGSLKSIIGAWYYALRNLAIVALLSILVYVSIRMILSTVSQDKAKYKMMFKDWLVALCLLFIIHYIMVGILHLSDMITNAIGTSGQSYTSSLRNDIEKLIDEAVYETDRIGTDDDAVIEKTTEALRYTVFFAATVIMNIIFLVKYLIRSVTIIFLALLAPITCITYPIDKISDGKAQAYDMWFKEFLYQVIIQPFHLLIYVVLVGSAATLAKDNVVYGMVCFGVMIPAEKFIKQMFGFKDKLGSPLGAFAGGAVASQLMSSLKSVGKSSSGGKDSDSNKTDNLPPNTKTVNLPGTDGSEGGGSNPRDFDEPVDETPTDGTPTDGTPTDGTPTDGTPTDGTPTDGTPTDGTSTDGTPTDGTPTDGTPTDGTPTDGTPTDGTPTDGTPTDGTPTDGTPTDGTPTDGTPTDGTPTDGTPTDGTPTDGTPTDGTQPANNQQSKKPGRWERAYRAANSRTSQHYLRKYGTTSLGLKDAKNKLKNKDLYGAASSINKGIIGRAAKRGIGKAYAGSKNLGRKAIKGATTLVGAAALGAFGAMFGQGKEMALVGAGLGGKIGNAVTNRTDKIAGTVEGYVGDAHNAFWDNAEQRDKEKFKEDKNNIRLARQNYRDRHDGVEAKGDALNDELERMYTMDSYGINQNQFNDVLSDFETYTDPEGEYRLSEGEAMDTAMSSALQAQVYSAKDFKDEKTMKQAYKNLLDQYEPYIRSGKISQEEADKKIRQILTGGARMKGVKGTPPLPKMEEFTITVPTARQALNIPELLGVAGSSDLTDEKIERLNTLTFKLQEKGYTPAEIGDIARNTADSRAQSIHVIDRYIAQAEFLTDEKAKGDARAYVAASRKVDEKEVEEKEVKVEMQERLELFKVGVKTKDMDGVRVYEDEVYKHHKKTDKERALKLTGKYSVTEMKEVKFMNKEIEDYAKELVKEGVVTGNGRKEAVEYFERAALYKGTELAHTIVVE